MQEAIRPMRFDLTSFLNGRTRAWGLVEDRFGRVRRSFSAELIGHWKGDVFVLDETFEFDDGEIDKRVWHVVPGSDGRFTATCSDCAGPAEGSATRDMVRMSYRFRLRLGGRTVLVDFDDRIHLVDDGLALNRATMSKWGVKVGELFVVFSREGAAEPRQEAA
jgi:hypothetical protein